MACRNHPSVDAGLITCSRCADSFCPNCVVYLQGAATCGGCKEASIRDSRAGVATQGLDLASVSRRFGALFLDGIMLNIASRVAGVATGAALGGAAGAAGEGDAGVVAAVVELVVWLGLFLAYEIIMVGSRGQTLGKMALKIKIVRPDGSNVTMGQAAIRALVQLIPILPYLPALFTQQKTGLHDMAAGTRVIRWG